MTRRLLSPDPPPGVVIAHIPAATRRYIGSPSLAVLSSGDYVASHDEFGPGSTQGVRAVSHVYRSRDRGRTWQQTATLQGAFWSTLFVHRGALYLIGTDKEYGNAVLRRSDDGGVTWTNPSSSTTGLIRSNGQYHCAPMPVIEHRGRLWRGMERRDPPTGWGIHFCAGMLSAPVDADLLNAANWTFTDPPLPSNRAWNGGDMGAWLEGNAVVSPDGEMLDILRVQTDAPDEKAALVHISPDGKKATFDPSRDFVPFPGGAKKFTIRFDPQSKLYWSLASILPERHRARNPGAIRNTLALTASPDLIHWRVRSILLYHPDTVHHGFQYVDWLFDGEDIIAACRTAWEDDAGGAHSNHDANFLTFHRFANFRTRSIQDSVPMPELPLLRQETADFRITGRDFERGRLADGEKAFSNRNYTWSDVPAPLRNSTFTRTAGGRTATITVQAKRSAILYLATALSQPGVKTGDWKPTGLTFRYSDAQRTVMTAFRRDLKAGEEVSLPQGNWTGGIALLPNPAP